MKDENAAPAVGSSSTVLRPPSPFDNWKREVFVGIDRSHALCCFILSDLRIDLTMMRAVVGSGVSEILRPQGGIGPQQVNLARPELTGLHKYPDRNACAYNTWLTAANAGHGLDTRKGIAQVTHDPLEQLRLLGAVDLLEQQLNIVYGAQRDHLVADILIAPSGIIAGPTVTYLA